MPHSDLKKQPQFPKHFENHQKYALSDIILGGQDGLVNVLGVILGVAAATINLAVADATKIILAAGFAATFAESISMAAVAYTSNVASRDYYLGQLQREKNEIKEVPELEKEEIREIYRKKGFQGELLEDVVKVITSNEKIWLETMMQEELHLTPVDHERPFMAAFIVGVSAMIGSFVPLMPFFFLSVQQGIILSLAVSALVLFIVGAVKARLTIGFWLKSATEITVIGIVSALIGFGVGNFFT
jgi:predicted membrane protein (TIGR00267 family)